MNRRLVKGLLGGALLALVVSSCQSGNPSTTAGGKALIAEPTTGVTFDIIAHGAAGDREARRRVIVNNGSNPVGMVNDRLVRIA